MGRAAVLFGAAASLAGCSVPSQIAGFKSPAMDPSSPVYQDVMSATRHPGPYPQFSDIPKIPTDIRPVSAWAQAVASIKHDKAGLDASVAALPAPPADTQAFAANARSAARPPAAADAAPPNTPDQAQAYAQSLRQRATPPPKRKAHKR
jgi:hypothetical protein